MKGPTLLLLHGGCHGAWAWSPVREVLEAEGANVVTPDLPGRDGAPTTLDELYTSAALALEQCGANTFVVAHSMGGALGVLLAARHPQLVAGVVFAAAVVPAAGVDPLVDGWGRVGSLPMRAWAALGARGGADRPPEVLSRLLFGHRLSPERRAWLLPRLNVERTTLLAEPFPAYELSRTPCLYVVAARDRVVPSRLQLRYATRAGGQAVVLDSGHSVLAEHPVALARIALGFAGSVALSRGSSSAAAIASQTQEGIP